MKELAITNLKSALENTKQYLISDEALQSLERDPYWPKWNTPWWHMSLMFELGLASEIPKLAVKKMTEVLKTHYLPVFPIRAEEIPEGTDPYRKIACFCAVANMYQVLFAAGVNVDQELAWMRSWFLQYQLPDGGLNCDESVYTKNPAKSSIVTTVACLEAVLFCTPRALTRDEVKFLNRGADYLLRQKLFRKVSTGEVIDSDWLEIKFPRFYDYDFFRGFYFLIKWHEKSGFEIPQDLKAEVKSLLQEQMTEQGLVLKRYNLVDKNSYNPIEDNKWVWGEASEFELLKAVSQEGLICEALTKKYHEIKKYL